MEGISGGRGNLGGNEELGCQRGILMAKEHLGGVRNLVKGSLNAEGGVILRISMVGAVKVNSVTVYGGALKVIISRFINHDSWERVVCQW